jgi:Triose-phosphate Transporter family.
MLIFVSQNIFAKKRLTIEKNDVLPTSKDTSTATNKKLDKLTILFYCSMVGFIFTLPVYLVSEFTNPQISILELNILTSFLIVLNGISHFLQSLLAFQILGLMSPINYSIANILKRIIIIIIAFLWESKSFTGLQVAGLLLTIFGLYCYDRWGTLHIEPSKES